MEKIIIVFLILLALALFLNWSNKALVVTQYLYRGSQVPAELDGYRIVQVSDLQSEYFGEDQQKLLQAVAGADPDLIVFTGDLTDRNHTDYEASLKAMEGLAALAPVYYVNGNHELALPEEDVSQMYDAMETAGICILSGKGETARGSKGKLYVAGLSEEVILESKERGEAGGTEFDAGFIRDAVKQLCGEAENGQLTVLLAHEPQLIDAYAGEEIDLVFAGHAHGGQIRLPFTQGLFAPGQGVLPKLTSGMHRRGTTTLIISRGLGNSVFPFRVFNRPEIVVAELKAEA